MRKKCELFFVQNTNGCIIIPSPPNITCARASKWQALVSIAEVAMPGDSDEFE